MYMHIQLAAHNYSIIKFFHGLEMGSFMRYANMCAYAIVVSYNKTLVIIKQLVVEQLLTINSILDNLYFTPGFSFHSTIYLQ